MIKNTVFPKPLKSSFLSCEKDLEAILKKLFIDSQPFSDDLKKLLIINTRDCLDNPSGYQELIHRAGLSMLRNEGYIKLEPKIKFPENEEVKSYILITFDNFAPSESNEIWFRDCNVTFDILCHTDYWDIGDFRLRPLKIAGIIDGILNGTKLSGIGTFQFMGCNELVLDENLSGYTLMYRAVHGADDFIEENA